MIIAWTFLSVMLILIVLITWDAFIEYKAGDKESGAKGVLLILFFILVASLPAQYIFGG